MPNWLSPDPKCVFQLTMLLCKGFMTISAASARGNDNIMSFFEVYPGYIQIFFSPFAVAGNRLINQQLVFCFSRSVYSNLLLLKQNVFQA